MLDPPKEEPGVSQIRPGGSQGHSNLLLGALVIASWAAMAPLGSHWGTLRAHLGVLGFDFGVPEGHFGSTRASFKGSWRAPWP